MPYSIGLIAEGDSVSTGSASAVSSGASTAPIAGGDRLIAVIYYAGAAAQRTVTLVDTVGGNDSWTRIGGGFSGGFGMEAYELIGAAAADTGDFTLEVTPNGAWDFPAVAVFAASGLDAGVSCDDLSYNHQASPGGSDDAITSTNLTPLAQSALVLAVTQNFGSDHTPTAGTGYTSLAALWDYSSSLSGRAEHRRITSTAELAATFTSSGSGPFDTVALVFRESGGGGLEGSASGSGSAAGSLSVKQNVLGSDIPSTGAHGPSVLYNDVELPAEANDWFRAELVTPPSEGTFTLYYDGSFQLIGAPNGIYTFTYEGFKNNVSYGTANATINIGMVDMAGAAVAQGQSAGALSIAKPMQGDAVGGASAIAGALSLQKGLAGQAVSGSLSDGMLSLAFELQGDALGSALAAGSLAKVVNLGGAAGGAGAAVGELSSGGVQQLAGAAAGAGLAAAMLALEVRMSATAVSASAAGGSIEHGVPLAGAASGAGLAQGQLLGAVSLSGAASGSGDGSGVLSLAVPLTAQAVANAVASGSLQLQVRMTADAVGAALAGGTLMVTSIVNLAGAATGGAVAAGSLTAGAGVRISRMTFVTSQREASFAFDF